MSWKEMAAELKREILRLLKEDLEFRYAIAGLLGLEEVLRRLDRIEENIFRLWEEIRALREETRKLWENQEKLWQEVKSLREGQEKLWENQNKLWEEVRALRENQEKLWENQNKLWENQEKLWQEVKSLREETRKLWISHESLKRYVKSGFTELRRALGVTFEMHAAAYIEVLLEEMGYPDARVTKRYFARDGEIVEVDLFCEEPLLVGEVTVTIEDPRQAEEEVMKLEERVGLVAARYGRRPALVILSVARPSPAVVVRLRELAEERGIRLILGREIEEELAI
ncbi:MAG: hypothetical protein NZ733_02225 [Aigarchaeota archaeon]|nr:hypothetical protein [Aigarchaeota archaeon]